LKGFRQGLKYPFFRRIRGVFLCVSLVALAFLTSGFNQFRIPNSLSIENRLYQQSLPTGFSSVRLFLQEDVNDPPNLFRWALVWWKDNTIACNIYLNATGDPSFEDVNAFCGDDILTAWKNTPSCTPSSKTGTQNCKGLYLLFIGLSKPGDESLFPKTPRISTTANLFNCPGWGTCTDNPKLIFSIESDQQSLPGHILKIEINQIENTCHQSSCILDMPLTDNDGVKVKYWAETSSGDILFENQFLMRNNYVNTDTGNRYLFELIGNDWETSSDAAANIWRLFPGTNTSLAKWMQRIDNETLLKTNIDYAMLAGRLIWLGYVDASGCPDSGLLPNGAADECGLGEAFDLVVEWQNRFDTVILRASQKTNVPPRILKGLIAQESQFWPLWDSKPEFGYGMMTENGIDLLLTWNTDYYLRLCNLHYTPDNCDDGYSSLTEEQQRFLRGVSLLSLGTDEEFVLLAEILKAAFAQTGHLVELITKKEPGEVYDYETLWRISLGVYTSGSGCMSEAINYSWNHYQRAMNWEEFKTQIQPGCYGAKDYFDKVVYYGSTLN
jgi:hypothetical protein